MLIFVGLLYPPQEEERLLRASKCGLQAAANNYQWGLIRGLYQVTGEKIQVLNSIPMGIYPLQSRILRENEHVVSVAEAGVHSHGYWNLPLVKQEQRENFIYSQLRRLILTQKDKVTVLVYSLYLPYLTAVSRLKKDGYDFNYILIVPDLPGEYGIVSGNSLIRHLHLKNGKKALQLAEYADAFLLLTEPMKEPLQVGDRPYTVVEGFNNTDIKPYTAYSKKSPPVLLYTGALEEALGIGTLIEAFNLLPDKNAQLKIAGAGSYEEELRHLCKTNQRIHFLGYLSKEEISFQQRQATVLVNPRSADEIYTKYSFPSKTMEYLATGVPVVMNKLPGIPQEYHPHIYFTEYSTAGSLAQRIMDVLHTEDAKLAKRGEDAIAFIRNEKSQSAQAEKIYKMILHMEK